MSQRSLIARIIDVIEEYRMERRATKTTIVSTGRSVRWLPSPGNVVFTLLVIGGLLWAQSAGALPLAAPSAASTGTIAYQGRLADTAGTPLTGTYNMTFRLYSAASGGAPLWEEPWNGANSVQVSDGLFNVMLGSLAPIPQSIVAANSSLFLGITVGTDSEMAPRVQLGSVPFAVQASTVPDGSVTTAKIADGAVTKDKLATIILEETSYTLTLPSWVGTTSSTAADFGSIDLSVTSDLWITGMWVLQNNTTAWGIRAGLRVDDVGHDVYGNVVPLGASGIGFTIARNYYLPAVQAGRHNFQAEIGQPPFQSGNNIGIGPGSVLWIRAVPTR